MMKKSAVLSILILGLAAALAAVPACASDLVLYDNTVSGTSYETNSYVINSYEQNTNSFILSPTYPGYPDYTITGAVLGVWLTPGDSALDVDWQIVSTPFATPNIAGGTSGVLSSTPEGTLDGFDMYQVSFSIPSLTLAAGTYYLEIDSIDTSSLSNIADWDVSNGASTGYIQDLSPLPESETFQILGATGGAIITPEPSSFLLLGSGLAGLAGLLKRKFRA